MNNTGPENNSLDAIRSYIMQYIDPYAGLERDDDAAEALANLDRIFADDGGTGLTEEQLQRYLDSLPE